MAITVQPALGYWNNGQDQAQHDKSCLPSTMNGNAGDHRTQSTQATLCSDAFRSGNVDFDVNAKSARVALLHQEDTDDDGNITIKDKGLKHFALTDTDGACRIHISGTYCLSNLLQETTLALDAGREVVPFSTMSIFENPVDRLHRRITDHFWTALTRRLDASSIRNAMVDAKVHPETLGRIYIPEGLDEQFEVYNDIALRHPEYQLEVAALPRAFTSKECRRQLAEKPGVLALQMRKQHGLLQPLPYIVPGGRFNEFFGWDSYFCALGVLEAGRLEEAISIVENWGFEIEHYGCIPNANRTYLMDRSQPPFLTDLLRRVYGRLQRGPRAESFLRHGVLAAIKEYSNFWTSPPRLDPVTTLSRYRPAGHGIPPEVEPGHFDWILSQYAEECECTIAELAERYNAGTLQVPGLAQFLQHDRAMRESGHDTSVRMQNVAADLATIDLNCLLYKYETDIAWAIRDEFGDHFEPLPDSITLSNDRKLMHLSSYWLDKAAQRKQLIHKYLWSADEGIFRDYNTASGEQTTVDSVTCFWALWSGVATAEQAEAMVCQALPKFECLGGLASSASNISQQQLRGRPRGQWDYPFGWAPHQILAWGGLQQYGYQDVARRLAYKWLYHITRTAVDHNGLVMERYDVTQRYETASDAEYGAQGQDFSGVPKEGFGWTNASYVLGVNVLGDDLREALRKGYGWEDASQYVSKQNGY